MDGVATGGLIVVEDVYLMPRWNRRLGSILWISWYLWLPQPRTASGVPAHKKHHVWPKISVWMASLPPPHPHKKQNKTKQKAVVPFKRYMSLTGRMNGSAQVNTSWWQTRGPRVSLLSGATITGPRCTWKIYKMWRDGWKSRVIDSWPPAPTPLKRAAHVLHLPPPHAGAQWRREGRG